MIVNGKEVPLHSPIFLGEFLKQKGYKIEHIAVELNGEIIPKKNYNQTFLSDADTLEVVTFVGGG